MSSIAFLNKSCLAAVVIVMCCAACSSHPRPAIDTGTGSANGTGRRVAVLPVMNMSGKPVPVKEVRQMLLREIIAQGVTVLDEGDLERFMERHRMRNIDSIDGVTARALKQETGMDGVLITTIERYEEAFPPVIALTCRMVAADETPVILWMETVALAGDDNPGLLGMGLIRDIQTLQNNALDRLLRSFASFLAGRNDWRTGSKEGTFEPKTFYSFPFLVPGRKYTIAVAPFLNDSERSNADNFLLLHFICQLTKAGIFNVVDPGALREKLLFFRIIMQEGLSLRQADLIYNSLQVDLILSGKVVEYEDAFGTPRVEFNVLVFDRKRVKIVWASWSFNRGNDAVRYFDWKRVSTAAGLAAKMTREVVRDMIAKGTLDSSKMPEEQPGTGPWAPYERGASPAN